MSYDVTVSQDGKRQCDRGIDTHMPTVFISGLEIELWLNTRRRT